MHGGMHGGGHPPPLSGRFVGQNGEGCSGAQNGVCPTPVPSSTGEVLNMLSSALIPEQGSVPKLVKAADVAAWFDISAATVRNYVRQGILPKPKRFGPRRFFF